MTLHVGSMRMVVEDPLKLASCPTSLSFNDACHVYLRGVSTVSEVGSQTLGRIQKVDPF